MSNTIKLEDLEFLGTDGKAISYGELEKLMKAIAPAVKHTPIPTTGGSAVPPPATSKSSVDDKVAEAIRNTLLQRKGAAPMPSAPATPAEPKIEKVVHTIKPGQKMASDLLGIKLKEEEDFPVTLMDKAKLDPKVSALVPFVDPDYKVQKDEAIKLLRAWEDGDKTLITGPTGSGKSSLCRYLAALTFRPFIRVNMTGDTESSTLFGGLVVRGGATVWEDGPVTEAVRYGAILLIDEWELMTPEIAMGMQWLLEDDGRLYLKEMPGSSSDKLITPHEHFRIVCGGNTVGQGDDTGSHAGTNVQNTATVDRFQTTIVLSYLDPEHEKAIVLKKYPKMDKAIVEKMVKVAALVRQGNQQGNLALTMSPRTLLNWAKKILTWGDVKVAFTIAYLDKLRESDRKVVVEMYYKVFGR